MKKKLQMKRIISLVLSMSLLAQNCLVTTADEIVMPTAVETEAVAPETQAPETQAPETQAPETQAPETQAPETQAPETQAPETQAPETQAPETQAPETQAPETQAPETQTPDQKEVVYRVAFDVHAADYGVIQVEEKEVAVSSYYKEVSENDKFTFKVVAKEGYAVDRVMVDNADVPKTVNENEYEIKSVLKETKIVITYKELPKEETVVENTAAEETTAENDVRKNVVTFEVAEGAAVTVDGADATNATAMAKDGTIVFAVDAAEGYEVTSVLVDYEKDARMTENADEYIIEGIVVRQIK